MTSLNNVSNADWNTDEAIPDSPEVHDIPVGWRVIVRPVAPQAKTKGGILLTQQTQDSQAMTETVGRLVAVGPQAWGDTERFSYPWANVGDNVMFGKYAGKKFEYGGVKYVLLNDDEIIGRVPDPTKLKR